jgi:ATP-dependent Clp protease ATP-binding subunit ClpA
MNIDIYSDRAKQAIQSAQSLAMARGHQQLAPDHLLKVLLEEKDGLARALITAAGGRPDALDQAVESLLAKTPKVEGAGGQLYMKPDLARVFDKAEKLIEKFRARAEALADDVEPTELRELLYYLVDTVLDRQPPAERGPAVPTLHQLTLTR